MAVNINKFWIEGLLLDAYSNFPEDGGIDFDGDGSINGSEVFGDLDGDGTVGSDGDYEKYLERNRAALSKAIPFFKWGNGLSVKNRIHWILYLESDLHADKQVESAYIFISTLVNVLNIFAPKGALSPRAESIAYYDMMKSAGITLKRQDDDSLVGNIAKKQLDCDTSSFVAIALGDERGIKLQLVRAPGHAFLRGRDRDGKEFNIDFGRITKDESYNVDPEMVEDKVYLETLDDRGLKAIFLANRGLMLKMRGRNNEALAVYDRALTLDPKLVHVHNNRGVVLEKLGRYNEALAACDRALTLDPKLVHVHNNRGVVLEKLGRYEEALAAFIETLKYYPGSISIARDMGRIMAKLEKLE
jgi:tetratricopeptide (TPR) repeat protein